MNNGLTKAPPPIPLNEIPINPEFRKKTKYPEINRVLGGGLTQGSIILLGGQPGIGKSTLLLELPDLKNNKILYFSGEESLSQIKIRSLRLSIETDNLLISNETEVSYINQQITLLKPDLIIIDSIQTIFDKNIPSAAGTIIQVRESCASLCDIVKKHNLTMVIIGHINKDGILAGPKVIEHIVDTVLYLEGDTQSGLRVLRSMKNRFGSTNEVAYLQLNKDGFKEIKNPLNELNISSNQVIGCTIAPIKEGSRFFLIEVQALVVPTNFNFPRRIVDGIEQNRVNKIIAILHKYLNIDLTNHDVYINITGGIKVSDVVTDLAIAGAVYSSKTGIPIKRSKAILGELGLTGEVRNSHNLMDRIKITQAHGITECIYPQDNEKSKKESKMNIQLTPVTNIKDGIRNLVA